MIRFTVTFLFFFQSRESIMIHHNLDLFCDIYNTITENNRRQTRYLSSIVNYFDIYVQVNQESFFKT